MRLWLARLAGTCGNQMLMLALGWQMYDLTGSAWDLGLVGLLQFLPAVPLVLPAGYAIDRFNRARLLTAVPGVPGGWWRWCCGWLGQRAADARLAAGGVGGAGGAARLPDAHAAGADALRWCRPRCCPVRWPSVPPACRRPSSPGRPWAACCTWPGRP
jgi:MFS family permease